MKNRFSNLLFAMAVGGLMVTGSAAAQTTTAPAHAARKAGPGAHDPGHPRVNQVNRRQTNQQRRIANGVKNDKLAPKQTAHIEKREAGIEKTEKRDMSHDNGHLTKGEQKNLNHREDKISNTIYDDKHPQQ
jgi:hypothetical protein